MVRDTETLLKIRIEEEKNSMNEKNEKGKMIEKDEEYLEMKAVELVMHLRNQEEIVLILPMTSLELERNDVKNKDRF